ncbi:ABC transporter permease [Cellulomonas shaoxiangyii]|uniref:ABC transporter permease n=1 Tax=Cellulomonas shaoxiangyii TaxID=2566013 RepID=A0A4V1CMX4_9CELL|nr:ABC transporter permease [Cellulomonas shaoxiangyii]QCB94455.1 ABC transporter permease [Cellulomonas shaoxiangyii]TGY85140.1 ABC transporter permease [Cellulomonas shaoxiangyii]
MSTTTSHPAPQAPSLGRASLLVAEREITSQVRSKSFIISTAVLLGAILVGIVISALIGQREPSDTPVAVVSSVAGSVDGAAGLEVHDVADRAAAEELVRSGEVEAALVPGGEPLGVAVLALEDAPSDVVQALTVSPEVELLEPAPADGDLRYLITFAFGLVFMTSVIGAGSMIAQNTVTEKQSRIVEILLSAVPARALLAGKILGNSVLALGQTAAIAAVAVLGLVVTGQDEVLTLIGMPVAWFVVFFAIGFVLLAAIFAASASLVSRVEDTGSVLQPAIWLTMVPYFLVIFFNDNDLVLRIMSFVPFTAPVGMPVRLFLNEAEWWEPLVALLVLVVSALAVTAVAARIYERSVLRMGGRVSVREALARSADD